MFTQHRLSKLDFCLGNKAVMWTCMETHKTGAIPLQAINLFETDYTFPHNETAVSFVMIQLK